MTLDIKRQRLLVQGGWVILMMTPFCSSRGKAAMRGSTMR